MPEKTPLPVGDDGGQHLFIVRIWFEADRRGSKPWRGSVEHVPSAQRLYFTSLGDLNDFITLRLGSRLAAVGDREDRAGNKAGEDGAVSR